MSGEREAEVGDGPPEEMRAASERATAFVDAVMKLAELAEVDAFFMVVSVSGAVVTRAAGTETHDALVEGLVVSSREALARLGARMVRRETLSGSVN